MADDGEHIWIPKMDSVKRDGTLDDIKSCISEIVAELEMQKEAKEKAIAERNVKIEAIQGLKEIKSAVYDIEKYHNEFNAIMDDEYNDGVFPPKKPTVNLKNLYEKYPCAAAYIKAEEWSLANNYIKAASGKKGTRKNNQWRGI